jgi:hypothetical protein
MTPWPILGRVAWRGCWREECFVCAFVHPSIYCWIDNTKLDRSKPCSSRSCAHIASTLITQHACSERHLRECSVHCCAVAPGWRLQDRRAPLYPARCARRALQCTPLCVRRACHSLGCQRRSQSPYAGLRAPSGDSSLHPAARACAADAHSPKAASHVRAPAFAEPPRPAQVPGVSQ